MEERELLSLKKKIDQAKTQVAELTGQKNYLMEDLKTTWKCRSISQAEELLLKLEKELECSREELAAAIQAIEEKYNV